MEQGKETIGVMRNIGKSIEFLSYTDDDYLAECIEFIESDEFGSKGKKEDVVEIVEKHPKRFIQVFRIALKKPHLYDAHRKTLRIMDIFDRILRTEE